MPDKPDRATQVTNGLPARPRAGLAVCQITKNSGAFNQTDDREMSHRDFETDNIAVHLLMFCLKAMPHFPHCRFEIPRKPWPVKKG